MSPRPAPAAGCRTPQVTEKRHKTTRHVRRAGIAAALLVPTLLLAACGGDGAPSTDAAPPAAAEPGPATDAGLPPGHPPLTPATPEGRIAPPPPGSGTGTAGLTWEAPAGWIEETPSSAMRRAQYRIPGPGGDGECVVFYFGPGQGGDAEANARRWADEFLQPGGGSSREVLETERLEVAGVDVLLAEVTGTYGGGMTMTGAPQPERTGYMLLGAIAAGLDANWFFKLTGPEATVRPQKEAFRAMIRSLRPAA